MALVNYEKSLKVAQMLNLDKDHADQLTKSVNSLLGFIPFAKKETVLNAGLGLGLSMAETLTSISNSD